ncbi:TenA family protein [Luteococcus sp. OSA5]|uniref:TenA family protein n=1 Tax=Luteococcus sp. OSA5 TaxID=3401630 RepID=UPI003B429F95
MNFSKELWAAAEPIVAAIHEHPFVVGLGDGSLPREVFLGYMEQDALYLGAYGRSMGLLAAKASRPEEVAFWAQGVHGAILAERELHAGHVVVDDSDSKMSPTCRGYTSFVLGQAATAPYEVGASAVLPCFWIYQVVGEHLLRSAGELARHPYGDWIGMYSDEAFAQSTQQAIAIVDRLAGEGTQALRQQMLEAFLIASRYEWMFWDAAWRRETWPV